MYYSIPENIIFSNKVKKIFKFLIVNYNFSIEIIDKRHYINVKYTNSTMNRRIEIKNEYDYTDYGFSIFVYNTINNEYNLLANVPFSKEDKECLFIDKTIEYLNNNYNLVDLLTTSSWVRFNHILYRIQE